MERPMSRPALLLFALVVILGVGWFGPAPSEAASGSRDRAAAFASAAEKEGVPRSVLLATSYALTHWAAHDGRPSAAGGYGPLHLTAAAAPLQGREALARAAKIRQDASLQTLAAAARLTHVSAARLRSDPDANIRGGAALLASYAGARKPRTVAGWWAAVARYGSGGSAVAGRAFADDVYATMRRGVPATTVDGQRLALAAQPRLRPDRPALEAQAPPAWAPECPRSLDCDVVPAAYDWSSADHSDPNNYGNYDPANRPAPGNPAIRYVVVHDTETSYAGTLALFQDPSTVSSSHYVIRSADGHVTQMVKTSDVAYHAGNSSINQGSIGIEQEGFATEGATWFTDAMYRSNARLVRYLSRRFGIPLDRDHVLGHDDVPRSTATSFSDAHWDPGPFWDWERYMKLLGAPIRATAGRHGNAVTIKPGFTANAQPVDGCDVTGTTCTPLPTQGTNFAYLRTAPDLNAPLIHDAVLDPTATAGTTRADDWSDKATAGQTFAVADRRRDWVAIWYGGQQAWLPKSATVRARRATVTAKPGAASVPLYGRAYPEETAYPAAIPPTPVTPIPWTLPAGQSYPVIDTVQGSNYFARFDAANVPGSHTLVTGATTYHLIRFNHRVIYVNAADVVPAG